MRYGSVCSGIEAATSAWESLGWQPAWFSEIEPFPCSVLEHHYPHVPNVGNMTQIKWMVESGFMEAPDVLVGGTPCQAFSVAGLRGGLDDPRGGLTLEFIKIGDAIDEQRRIEGKEPSIIVWENVPGVLNSKDNAFGAFLGGLCGEECELLPSGKKWTNAGCVYGPKRTVSWRVLDAQYFRLAQRRKRVFVVASARDLDPSQILFEFDGLRRDTPPSRETGKSSAECFEPRSPDGHARVTGGISPTLNTAQGEQRTPCVFREGSFGQFVNDGSFATLKAQGGTLGGGSETFVLMDQGGSVMGVENDLVGTHGHEPIVSYALAGSMIGRQDHNGPNGSGHYFECSPTQAVADIHAVANQTQVRRLTPVECERLQGFPDNHTLVPHRGKPAADGPRYKALGNSMAVPVMRWIGERINDTTR